LLFVILLWASLWSILLAPFSFFWLLLLQRNIIRKVSKRKIRLHGGDQESESDDEKGEGVDRILLLKSRKTVVNCTHCYNYSSFIIIFTNIIIISVIYTHSYSSIIYFFCYKTSSVLPLLLIMIFFFFIIYLLLMVMFLLSQHVIIPSHSVIDYYISFSFFLNYYNYIIIVYLLSFFH